MFVLIEILGWYTLYSPLRRFDLAAACTSLHVVGYGPLGVGTLKIVNMLFELYSMSTNLCTNLCTLVFMYK